MLSKQDSSNPESMLKLRSNASIFDKEHKVEGRLPVNDNVFIASYSSKKKRKSIE